MSDIITNTTNTNDCKVFKVYLSKYTATNISSNSVINNSTVNGINVTNALNNLQNTKLDKGTYVGTAQDLYTHIEGKIEAGYNSIPKVGNGASGKVLTDSVVSQIYGKIGIGIAGEASERLEVNGNIKANSYKFNLPASITPTPNTLVPKTNGSGLMWYNNSSVGAEIPSYSSPISGYVARWDGTKFVNGSIQDNGSNIGIGGAASSISKIKFYGDGGLFDFTSLTNSGKTPTNHGEITLATLKKGLLMGHANRNSDWIHIRKLGGLSTDDSLNWYNGFNFNTVHNDYNGACLIDTGMPNYSLSDYFTNFPNAAGHGFLHSVKAQYSGINTQYFIDMNGDLFTRGGRHDVFNPWRKQVRETVGETTQLSEKINATKGVITKDLSFTLQASITPTPNTLVPKTDGSGLLWYDNSTVACNLIIEKINTTTILTEKLGLARVKLKTYTKTERDALTNKEVGEVIWQTDSGNSGIRVYDGTNWLAIQTIID